MLIHFKNSRVSVIINTFYKSQVLFGIDFGYFNCSCLTRRYLFKCFCLVFGTITCSLMFHFLIIDGSYSRYWYSFYLAQYFTIILIFILRKPDETLFKFKCALKEIDTKLRAENASRFVEKKELLCIGISYLYRVIWSSYYCNFYASCMKPVWLTVAFSVMLTTLDITIITHALLFYSINHRLEILVHNLKETSNDFAYYQGVYKLIADVTEKFKKIYDLAFLLSLLCSVPEMMFSLYNIIKDIKETNESAFWMLPFRVENIAEIIQLSITIAPAMFAGMLCTQAETIKTILYDKRLSENNSWKIYEIGRFIDYVEARPLKFTVYEVIPLDANLLGMVAHFCVTYLIVMIQLTHLY